MAARWPCWDASVGVGYPVHDVGTDGVCSVCGAVVDWVAFARAARADPARYELPPDRTGRVVYRDGRWVAVEEAA